GSTGRSPFTYDALGATRPPRYILVERNARAKPSMSERSLRDEVRPAAPAPLTLRRALFFALVGTSIAALIGLLVLALTPGGFDAVDFVLVVLFAVTLPWYVIGFWNGVIGLCIMRFPRDPVATGRPATARITGQEPIIAATPILL